jgi:hypothetical protein
MLERATKDALQFADLNSDAGKGTAPPAVLRCIEPTAAKFSHIASRTHSDIDVFPRDTFDRVPPTQPMA